MRCVFTLLAGVVLGFGLAHVVNQTPRGRRFFETINEAAHEIGEAVVQGYREAE